MAFTPILFHSVSVFLQVALGGIMVREGEHIPQRRQRCVSPLRLGLVGAISSVFGLVSGRHVGVSDVPESSASFVMKVREL